MQVMRWVVLGWEQMKYRQASAVVGRSKLVEGVLATQDDCSYTLISGPQLVEVVVYTIAEVGEDMMVFVFALLVLALCTIYVENRKEKIERKFGISAQIKANHSM